MSAGDERVDVVGLGQRGGHEAVLGVGRVVLPDLPDAGRVAAIGEIAAILILVVGAGDEVAFAFDEAGRAEAEVAAALVAGVELAEEGRVVARRGEPLGEGDELGPEARLARLVVHVDVVIDAVAAGVESGEDRGPRGGADGEGGEGLPEERAFGRQAIEVGRPHDGVAHAAEDLGVMLVAADQQDARPRHERLLSEDGGKRGVSRRGSRGKQRQQRREETTEARRTQRKTRRRRRRMRRKREKKERCHVGVSVPPPARRRRDGHPAKLTTSSSLFFSVFSVSLW